MNYLLEILRLMGILYLVQWFLYSSSRLEVLGFLREADLILNANYLLFISVKFMELVISLDHFFLVI